MSSNASRLMSSHWSTRFLWASKTKASAFEMLSLRQVGISEGFNSTEIIKVSGTLRSRMCQTLFAIFMVSRDQASAQAEVWILSELILCGGYLVLMAVVISHLGCHTSVSECAASTLGRSDPCGFSDFGIGGTSFNCFGRVPFDAKLALGSKCHAKGNEL